MAYELHIERESGKISLAEWVDAVMSIEGVVLEGSPQIAKNPKTGEVITIGGNPNNLSVRFEKSKLFGFKKEEVWITCIFFRNGYASFNATNDTSFGHERMKEVVSLLAKKLNAQIIGDNGEKYDVNLILIK